MASSSSSSSSSSSDHKDHHTHGSNSIVEPVGFVDSKETEPQFNWNQPLTCALCKCFDYVLQLVMMAAFGSFLFGINISLLNTCIDYIAWEFEWCNWKVNGDITGCSAYKNYAAFMSVGVFVGAAIGSMTGGGFLKFGRRTMLMMSMYLFIFGIISSVCANSFPALVWARLVVGYAVGIVSVVVPVYMSEVTPANKRGQYGVFHQLFITIGIFFGVLIGLPIALVEVFPDVGDEKAHHMLPTFGRVWWRVMLGFGMLPVLICLMAFRSVYTFETPNHYIENRQYADAEILLKKLYKTDDVTEVMHTIRTEIDLAEASKKAGMTLGKACGNAEYRNVIALGCVFSAFQQFGGINVFMASSNKLFKEAGVHGGLITVCTVILDLVNMLMTLPAVPLIERMGRKSLLLMGTAGQTISVFPAMICYFVKPEKDGDTPKVTMWLAIVGCIIFIIFFATAYGPVLWVWLFEIYPSEIKGVAGGLATAWNWIAGIVMVFITQYISNKIAYLVFTIMSGISFLLVLFFMKETKGRILGDSPYITKKMSM